MTKEPVTPEMLQKFLRRLIAARENGSNGGYVRAGRYSSEKLSIWATQGGRAVLEKYGRQYFVALRERRKHYPKQNEPHVVFQASFRVVAAKKNGQRGGLARAELHGPDERKEWARQGGIATRTRHGNEFYREIRKIRTYYRKSGLTRKAKKRLQQILVDMKDMSTSPALKSKKQKRSRASERLERS